MIKETIKKIVNKINGSTRIETSINDNLLYQIRRQYIEEKILSCRESGVCDAKYCDSEIIVSLTTYGRRLDYVAYAIESVMQQSMKANRIILWLAKEDFVKPLPPALRAQMSRGLEIRETSDTRSYKKIIPALAAYPDSVIITVDDDVMYDFELIGRLITAYQNDPSNIYAGRTHVIKYDDKGKLTPYLNWNLNSSDNSSPQNNFFTGVGGVLYPPHSLHPDVLKEDVFMNICKTADDVWLNVMSRLAGTKVIKVRTKSKLGDEYVLISDIQDMGLLRVNVWEGSMNDQCINNVLGKYNLSNFEIR